MLEITWQKIHYKNRAQNLSDKQNIYTIPDWHLKGWQSRPEFILKQKINAVLAIL